MSRVLVIGDTHCPGMLPRYPSFLKRIHDRYECTKVIHIGDLVDNAAISYHEKHPSMSSAQDEFWKAKMQVGKITALFPKVEWLIGNHDALTERQCVTAGLLPGMLKQQEDIWGLPSGWNVHPRFSRYKLENTVYSHGDAGKGGMYSSVKNSRDNFTNWVQGHNHSEAGVWYTTVEGSRVFGMNVGCGVDNQNLAFNYGRKFNKKPTLGCGVVIDGKRAIFEPF